MSSFNRYYYKVDITNENGKRITVPYSVKARTNEEANNKIDKAFKDYKVHYKECTYIGIT